jgi:hypothetical protein
VRRICWILAAAAIFGVAMGDVAQADAFYSYTYVAGQPVYTAAPNSDIFVPIYLQEVSTVSGDSLLIDEGGLFGAGVSVSATGLPSSPATLTALSGNAGATPSGFDGTVGPSTVTPTSASIVENTDFLDSVGVAAGPQVGGVSDVLLGTLTVHTGSLSAQTTTFTVGPLTSDPGNTLTFTNFYDLDNNADPGNPEGSDSLYSSAASTTFTVTTTGAAVAVPEPSSFVALCGLGALGLLIATRRRRTA